MKKVSKHIKTIQPLMLRLAIVVCFVIVLVSVIGFARGYRFDPEQKRVTSTGVLAVSSNQKASKVFINGELKGITDINLTLPPGEYNVDVKKVGYTDWSNKINLKGEIVMSIDAALYPRNPSLSPVTDLGIIKAVPIAQTGKILLFTENEDAERDGIYIYESNQQPISFFAPLKLISFKKNLPSSLSFKNTTTYFKPDYSQAIIEFTGNELPVSYLFNLGGENLDPINTSSSKESILNAWNENKDENVRKVLETLPRDLQKIASDSFHIISFSPDDTKVLYEANREAQIPQIIKSPVIGANQSPEERLIRKNQIYIYDIKEDKNFAMSIDYQKASNSKISPTPAVPGKKLIISPTPTPKLPPANVESMISWLPDSRHVIIQQDKRIIVRDYDGSNEHTVYSGPFEADFFAVSADGKLFVLSNLNPQNNKYADLYQVGIK